MCLGLEMELVGYGIIAVASPRVAAQDAAYGEVQALERSVFLDGLHGVLRTSGGVATRGRRQRADATLIETDGEYEETTEQVS